MIWTRILGSIFTSRKEHPSVADANDYARAISKTNPNIQVVLYRPTGLFSDEHYGYWQRGKYQSVIRPNNGTMEVKPLR